MCRGIPLLIRVKVDQLHRRNRVVSNSFRHKVVVKLHISRDPFRRDLDVVRDFRGITVKVFGEKNNGGFDQLEVARSGDGDAQCSDIIGARLG